MRNKTDPIARVLREEARTWACILVIFTIFVVAS